MDYKKEYQRFLQSPLLNTKDKAQLILIRDDEDEIKSRFMDILSFGTAGLRGVLACGTNRMNVYTVRSAAYGLAKYIVSLGKEAMERGVVITRDSRHQGEEFVINSALVLCKHNIKTYVFDDIRPTPELSFAVRHLKAIAGINITASHNPKEYNGFKAYFEDGAQIMSEIADYVFDVMNKTDMLSIETADMREAIDSGLLEFIGDETDKAYLDAVFNQSLKDEKCDIDIVYTPFHGTGYKHVPEILNKIGCRVYPVDEQMVISPDFETVKSPNPEEKEGFELAINKAKKIGAKLILATDPDCDRIGVCEVDGEEKTFFTGNQIGALLLEYIIKVNKEKGVDLSKLAVISTIVSTRMTKEICEKNGVNYYDVLTGFKNIGNKIKELHSETDQRFLFAFEESYGYLMGDYARDKDAVLASMIIAQMADYYYKNDKTLSKALELLYVKYGTFFEKTMSVKIEDVAPLEKMKKIMENIRKNSPQNIAGTDVSRVLDYKTSMVIDVASANATKENLPHSDVLTFEFTDGNSVIIRPSGTEPKIKLYFLMKGKTKAAVIKKQQSYEKAFLELLR